jgi:hypothetical protein
MPTLSEARRAVFGCCLLAAAMLNGSAVGAAGIPPETAARLDRALQVLDKGFVGSYRVTVHAVIEKPGGKDRKESLRVVAMSRRADGTSEDRLVKALENGKDVTEQEQSKAAKAMLRPTATAKPGSSKGAGDKGEGSDKKTAELKLPSGEEAKLYRFGAPVEEGELIIATFEPLPEHRKEDGMAKGRLAWRRDTLDPAWFEVELVVLPTGVSELFMRFEFARQGDLLYPRLTVTRGAGGILWIKRNFNMQMEISDVTPAPVATPVTPTGGQ